MPEKARLCEGILPVSVMLYGWSFKEINLLILLQHIWLTASSRSLLAFNITVLLMRRMRGKWSVCGHYRLFFFFFPALHLQSNCTVPLYRKQQLFCQFSVHLCFSSYNLGLASALWSSIMGGSGMSTWLTCFAGCVKYLGGTFNVLENQGFIKIPIK